MKMDYIFGQSSPLKNRFSQILTSESNFSLGKVFILWALFTMLVFPTVTTANCEKDPTNSMSCNADQVPFEQLNDKIELQLDWLEEKNDVIYNLCNNNITCCAKAENASLYRYVYHSLGIENIEFDQDENALLETSVYVDENLRFEEVSLETILSIHKMVMKSKSTMGGSLRKIDVGVKHPNKLKIYSTPPFDTVESRMMEFMKWVTTESRVMHPIQRAILLKLNFVSIHPFEDGNGRISRLLFNWLLRESGYLGWTSFLVEDIDEYYDAISESTATTKNLTPFLQYVIRSMAKSFQWFHADLKKCLMLE